MIHSLVVMADSKKGPVPCVLQECLRARTSTNGQGAAEGRRNRIAGFYPQDPSLISAPHPPMSLVAQPTGRGGSGGHPESRREIRYCMAGCHERLMVGLLLPLREREEMQPGRYGHCGQEKNNQE